MAEASSYFEKPGALDRLVNSIIGGLVRRGLGPSHMQLLEVRGRKSGRLYSLPVDPLEIGSKSYLVAPRGRTQWVRNAEAQGRVTLKRGKRSTGHRVRALSNAEKPPILKAYLDRYRREVQRYFSVPAGSPKESFEPEADRYPVLELIPEP